ncbi:Hypothetical predicted protein, partial [Marmota monax]
LWRYRIEHIFVPTCRGAASSLLRGSLNPVSLGDKSQVFSWLCTKQNRGGKSEIMMVI